MFVVCSRIHMCVHEHTKVSITLQHIQCDTMKLGKCLSVFFLQGNNLLI